MLVIAQREFVGRETDGSAGLCPDPQATVGLVQATHEITFQRPWGGNAVPMVETLTFGHEEVDTSQSACYQDAV